MGVSQKTRNTQGIHANEYQSMGIVHWASVFVTSSLAGIFPSISHNTAECAVYRMQFS